MGFYQQLQDELKLTRRRMVTAGHTKRTGKAAATLPPPGPSTPPNGSSTAQAYRMRGSAQPRARAFGSTTYRVPGIVWPIRQPTSSTCWATTMTILTCWRDAQSIPIDVVIGRIGPVWLAKFKADQALSETDEASFIAAAGLQAEPPQSYSIDGWMQMLRVYGPLWITASYSATSHPFSMHARVLVGMTTDGTEAGTTFQVVDSMTGTEYSESMSVFIAKFEAEALVPNSPLVLQVIHWAAGTQPRSEPQQSPLRLSESIASYRAYPRAFGPPPLAWGAKVSQGFRDRVRQIAGNLNCEPDFLMACMAFETGETFSPSIKNGAGSGATGLIQFMPSTARNLGTTVDDLARMSAEDQLTYVEKYFQPFKGKLASIEDVYMCILWPAAVGKSDDFVLFSKTSKPKTYEQNRGLDRDHDGNITKQEAASMAAAKLAKGQLSNNAM